MLNRLLLVLGLVIAGFIGGYYAHQCPPCAPVVQLQPQTITTEVAKPALDAVSSSADREAKLQQQIADLKAEAAKRPAARTLTLVKEVPADCHPHVERQAKADASACLEPADIDLINRARSATEGK